VLIRSFLVGLALMVAAPVALASPDVTNSVPFSEPDFGLFSGQKSLKIYADSNPEDPFPGNGRYTYVYTLSNDPSSLVSLISLQIQIPAGCEPATVGFFPGAGDPDSPGGTFSNGLVEWTFGNNPIAPGASSSEFYVTSACGPSPMPDLVYAVDSEALLSKNAGS
jgi:hypothetical protein